MIFHGSPNRTHAVEETVICDRCAASHTHSVEEWDPDAYWRFDFDGTADIDGDVLVDKALYPTFEVAREKVVHEHEAADRRLAHIRRPRR